MWEVCGGYFTTSREKATKSDRNKDDTTREDDNHRLGPEISHDVKLLKNYAR